MSQPRFTILMSFLGLMLLLSFFSFPGGLIGVFAAMGLAMTASLASSVFIALGIDLADGRLYALMVGALLLLIAAYVAMAWRNWQQGNADRARIWAARAAICVASPLVALVSMQTMMHDWA